MEISAIKSRTFQFNKVVMRSQEEAVQQLHDVECPSEIVDVGKAIIPAPMSM